MINKNFEASIQLLSFLPLGFTVGILTERLATRNVAATSFPKVWTTVVKCTASWLVWNYMISLHKPSDAGFGVECTLPVLTTWLDNHEVTKGTGAENLICTAIMEGSALILIFILRCTLFCSGCALGTALQPVGLTGGIACGKSTVSSMLSTNFAIEEECIAIVDVDRIAHDILIRGKMGSDCAYSRIVKIFHGCDIFTEKSSSSDSKTGLRGDSQTIDRRKLGDIIFRDARRRKALNGVTHPLISKIMIKQIVHEKIFSSNNGTNIVSVDIPLLFEVGFIMRMLFAIKVVVACDDDIQLRRLKERNKDLTEEQCKQRIESQIPIQEKTKMADIVIWNNGTRDDLLGEVKRAKQAIINRSHAFMGVTLVKSLILAGILTFLRSCCDIIMLVAGISDKYVDERILNK